MTSTYSTDIVIFGGGIAGLWLLNRLRSVGYHAILLEANTLGGGQTIASQGIIHGGLKYALSGSLTDAAKLITQLPMRWRRCLQGDGDIDLSECELLSEHYYMWSNADFRSKLFTFLGSKGLSGRVEAVATGDYPEFFKQASVAGSLYRLPDFVIDTESLLRQLVKNQTDYLFRIEPTTIGFNRNASDDIDSLSIELADSTLRIETQRIVFCAGEGNRDLIEQAKLTQARSQIRPLKMVYLKKRTLPPVYVHCIGNSFSLTPKLTITSHTDADGLVVWYLGGELAEAGVNRTDDQLLAVAKELVADIFPWVDIEDAQWGCFMINRAEANVNNDYRPDGAYCVEESKVIAAWPTKLTLTPTLADKVIRNLEEAAVTPSGHCTTEGLSDFLQRPQLASAHWE